MNVPDLHGCMSTLNISGSARAFLHFTFYLLSLYFSNLLEDSFLYQVSLRFTFKFFKEGIPSPVKLDFKGLSINIMTPFDKTLLPMLL